MNAAALLARLSRVHQSGPGAWRADCPNGHEHARGTLSIKEADDGRVLIHCFACGDTPGILAAVGLELADLFPERIRDPSPEGCRKAREAFRRSSWDAALRVLSRESTVVLIVASDLQQGRALADADAARLAEACQRIEAARDMLLPEPDRCPADWTGRAAA